MANGFCPAVLDHMAAIAGQNYSGAKVTQQGFLLSLLNSVDQPKYLSNLGYSNGHNREIRVKFKPRAVEGQASDSLSCDNNGTNAWQETTVTLPYVASISTYVDYEDVRQYCQDASRMTSIGGNVSPKMAEVLDALLNRMNALYAKMETDLTTNMAGAFGRNANGGSTDTTLNIPLTGTSNNLSEGFYSLLADVAQNEFCGTPVIVGNGLFHRYHMGRMASAFGNNQSGVDQSAMADALGYQFYYSQKTATTWGSDDIGVFAPGSVHLVQYNRNEGSFAGKHGTSEFAKIIDPRVQCWTPGGYQNLEFDVQFRDIDCPTTIRNDYTGQNETVDRGMQIIVSTSYGLFVQPKTGFDGNDVIRDQNGTLRYSITNA